MTNLDLLEVKKLELKTKLGDALKAGDSDAFSAAFVELGANIEERVLGEAKGLLNAADTTVLVARGVRQLTSEEKSYYEKVAVAMKAEAPAAAMAGITEVMPKTVIDSVFEDLRVNHPLLSKINFVPCEYTTEFLINKNGTQLAQWGTLTDAIKKELTSSFAKVSIGVYKLSAFLPIAKSTLDLGPAWLDRYIREILAESIALGLEQGIISGTGKDMPIGADRQCGEDVTISAGVYPQKAKVAVTSFSPAAYGKLLAENLAKTEKGNPRVVSNVILIVNPWDYLKLVMPATTVQTPNGTYVNNVLPYPTEIIQSTQITQGEAILGIADRYFMGCGMEKNGKIEYDDSIHFFEDERVYAIKTYANGRPKDNTSFVLLDISGLVPQRYEVAVISAPETPTRVSAMGLPIGANEGLPLDEIPGDASRAPKTKPGAKPAGG